MSFPIASAVPTPHQLSELVDMGSSAAVWGETQTILCMIDPQFPVSQLGDGFDTIVTIFNGSHPDYKACDTGFHDLQHTTDVFLGVCRMIHGAILSGLKFTPEKISTALIATLFHDSGYIQQKHENAVSGAIFADQHVQRSMNFFERYMRACNAPGHLILAGREMIHCSNLEDNIDTAQFSTKETEWLGRILKAGDLISQMADRLYLEKLLLLYEEFEHSANQRFRDELDLLIQTVQFYEQVDLILEDALPEASDWLAAHFDRRYGLDQDLYGKAMQNQRTYLLQQLNKTNFDPGIIFRRGRIASALQNESSL